MVPWTRAVFALTFAASAMACSAAPPPAVPRTAAAVAAPAAPTSTATTGLERATDEVKVYLHDTVDPDSSMPTVGGYVRVHAPLDVAYAVAMRFDEYKDLIPDVEQSTVVDKHTEGSATDLYLRIPTFSHDYVWAVIRFRPAGAYAYRGDQIEGNLDDLRIHWRLLPDGDGGSIAQFELLADPHMPIPHAWLLPELRAGVRIMLERFRAKAELAANP